ncbi:MAG: YbjQ family protein [Eggerthellaceae bacterium]
MLITTTDVIPGRAYQPLGLVRGNVAYCKHLGRDIMASFKNLAGGEINSYTDMLNEARDIAEARMVDQATRLGADAIVGMRFMNDTVCEGTIEVIAYGTAVKLQ